MEQPIRLPEDGATARARLTDGLCREIRRHRAEALSALRRVPAFLSAVAERAADGARYRVLVSKENMHLLREGANGITKPWLRDSAGRFVENVDLVRLPPDVAGILAPIALQAALTELSVKLDVVIRGIDNLSELIRNTTTGGLQGAIDNLEVARRLSDDQERRTQMLRACGRIIEEIGSVAGQMKVNVAQMPTAETDFWTGWRGSGVDEAEKKWKAVHQDFAVIADGLRRSVSAYWELGEFGAAQQAFERIWNQLVSAGLQTAADRARLLPYPEEGDAPELVFENFLAAMPLAAERLRLLASGETPELEFTIEASEVQP